MIHNTVTSLSELHTSFCTIYIVVLGNHSDKIPQEEITGSMVNNVYLWSLLWVHIGVWINSSQIHKWLLCWHIYAPCVFFWEQVTDPPMYNVASAVLWRSLAIVRSLPLPGCGVGLCFLWFYVQELLKAQPAVVLVLKRLRRRGNGLKSHPIDWEKPGIEPATNNG